MSAYKECRLEAHRVINLLWTPNCCWPWGTSMYSISKHTIYFSRCIISIFHISLHRSVFPTSKRYKLRIFAKEKIVIGGIQIYKKTKTKTKQKGKQIYFVCYTAMSDAVPYNKKCYLIFVIFGIWACLNVIAIVIFFASEILELDKKRIISKLWDIN